MQQQCDEKLGFKPYPGTLNLEISEEFLPAIELLDQKTGIELISPDPQFCNAMVFQVSLQDIIGDQGRRLDIHRYGSSIVDALVYH
ncbi:MAG: DUF120 domain-containing protein [Gammaproteobacteria bacterium]